MAILHLCMRSLPGLWNGLVNVVIAVIFEVNEFWCRGWCRCWCHTWLRRLFRSMLALRTPSSCVRARCQSVKSRHRRTCTVAPAGGEMGSYSLGLSSSQMVLLCKLFHTLMSPRCSANLRSLPCLAVFKFGYMGSSHRELAESSGPHEQPTTR